MSTLMELRERVLTVYSQYETYINMGVKLLVVLLGLIYINSQIGYQATLSGVFPTFIIALICTLLPPTVIVAVYSLIMLVQLYSLTMEAAIVGAVLFLVMLLVYYRFTPKDSLLLLLYPLFRAAGIPYALPVAGGLLYSPASGATVAVGIITDNFIRFVHQNETAIHSVSESGTDGMVVRLQFLLDGIMQDRKMMICVIAAVVAAIAVYLLRRLPIQYSWYIASGAGALCQLLVLLIGTMMYNLDISIPGIFLGCAAAFGIGAVITFFVFNLDYTRIENTQFEDDDYYYYVKAVPKNVFARPKRTVKTINTRRGTRSFPEERRTAGENAPESFADWRDDGYDVRTGDGRVYAGDDYEPVEDRYPEDVQEEYAGPEDNSYADDVRDDF